MRETRTLGCRSEGGASVDRARTLPTDLLWRSKLRKKSFVGDEWTMMEFPFLDELSL